MSRTKAPTRVYFPGPIAVHGVCVLPPEQAHHVTHVLRLAPGDDVVLFDGVGREYPARIEAVAKSGARLSVSEARAVDRESPLEVVLAQGISSGDRMDYTVQKAVELGAATIQPLSTERSIVRLDTARAAKRVAHWQAVAAAACEQCGRNVVPQVLPVISLPAWLGTNPAGLRVTLAPGADATLRELARPPGPVTLLVGPEGGLTPREQRDADTAGFTRVRLGPRVLRTETAALATLAAMQALWGDF